MEQFQDERMRLNEIVMRYAGQEVKRFYSLDSLVIGFYFGSKVGIQQGESRLLK
jgi:hypothetical protein